MKEFHANHSAHRLISSNCIKHVYYRNTVPHKLRSALKMSTFSNGRWLVLQYLKMNNESNAQEALEHLVKSFGIDPTALGGQAESVWRQLNDLHESNPASYQSFMQTQMNRMKEEEKTGITIIPTLGFVVAVEVQAVFKGGARKNIFVNMCQHEAIRRPQDEKGKQLDLNASTAANIEIPLVVSQVRSCSDENDLEVLVADVIFHPCCLSRAKAHPEFKADLINLAIAAIREDRNLALKNNWKYTMSGGKGKGMDVKPFSISKGDKKAEANAVLEKIMENPASLLHTLGSSDRKENGRDFSLRTTKGGDGGKKTGNLIVEIGEVDEELAESFSNETNQSTRPAKSRLESNELMKQVSSSRKICSKSKSSPKPIVPLATKMKGFLNRDNAKSPPRSKTSNSANDISGAEGIRSELVSTCKVVDASEEESKPCSIDAIYKTGVQRCPTNQQTEAHKKSVIEPQLKSSEAINAGAIHEMISELTITEDVNKVASSEKRKSSLPFTNKHSTNKSLFLEVDLSSTLVTSSSDLKMEILDNQFTLTTTCGKHLCYYHPLVSDNIAAKFKRKQMKLVVSIPSLSVK